MTKFILSLLGSFLVASTIFGVVAGKAPSPAVAQVVPLTEDIILPGLDLSPTATETASLASPAAEVVQKIQEKKDQDITEFTGLQKSKLAAMLDENPIGPLSWNNFLQYSIRNSIEKGLPANITVLVLLFPLIALLITISRHLIGIKGFGIYIPAVLAIAFVSTGIPTGIAIFIAVLLAVVIARKLIVRLRLPYLPRNAMLLWAVSIFILVLLMASAYFDMFSLLTVNIFPLLIIISLSENFMESQFFTNQKEAIRLTVETLAISILGALLINLESLQQFVLLHPEITLIAIAATNYVIGKYKGLRLLEYLRFRPILEQS